jgi:chromosomal replication initiation ATPase DnaA
MVDPELEKVVQACWEWSQAFQAKQTPRWLTLAGTSGTGKTHCALRLWQWAAGRSNFNEAEFVHQPIVWPRFVQRLRSGNGFEMRDDLLKWPVLFIDDIGSERDTTGFATEEMVALLMSRMGKWTLITSNKTPEALRALDERLYSRLIRDHNIFATVRTKDYSER